MYNHIDRAGDHYIKWNISGKDRPELWVGREDGRHLMKFWHAYYNAVTIGDNNGLGIEERMEKGILKGFTIKKWSVIEEIIMVQYINVLKHWIYPNNLYKSYGLVYQLKHNLINNNRGLRY